MRRIAITGNAGGGKSTLGRRLRDVLHLPLHSIDQIAWRPGWQRTPAAEFARAHAGLIAQPRWIVDGLGDLDSIRARFGRSDTIVFIDFPLWLHYWWTTKRQCQCLLWPRMHSLPGYPLLPVTGSVLRLIWSIDRHTTPRLRPLVAAHRGSQRVVTIRSPGELRAFYREIDRLVPAAPQPEAEACVPP